MRPVALIYIVMLLAFSHCDATTEPPVGGPCDGCDGIYQGMDENNLSWETTIADAAEPGQRIEISGVIYQPDGKTPAPDVILYVYHTDNNGYYSPSKDQSGSARRHGHLRGWMKTNTRGEYKFRTIKPAAYPNQAIPAHIHPIIKEQGKKEYYLDEYRFDDDPLLTQNERNSEEKRGGSGMIHLQNGPDGILSATRNITLGMNIPNYR